MHFLQQALHTGSAGGGGQGGILCGCADHDSERAASGLAGVSDFAYEPDRLADWAGSSLGMMGGGGFFCLAAQQ